MSLVEAELMPDMAETLSPLRDRDLEKIKTFNVNKMHSTRFCFSGNRYEIIIHEIRFNKNVGN